MSGIGEYEEDFLHDIKHTLPDNVCCAYCQNIFEHNRVCDPMEGTGDELEYMASDGLYAAVQSADGSGSDRVLPVSVQRKL